MKTFSISLVFTAGILLAIQPAPAAQVEGGDSISLCLATVADAQPVYPTTAFPSPIKNINAVYTIAPSHSFKQLTAIWTAVDVPGTSANAAFSTFTLDVADSHRGTFKCSVPDQFPPGKYRLNVMADNRHWLDADFTIVPEASPVTLRRPSELVPLARGTKWIYSFKQEFATGAVTGLGAEPTTQETIATATVTGADPMGTRVELRTAGQPMAVEWWKVDSRGLVATQREIQGERHVLDPPQVLVSLPLNSKTWTYKPKDENFSQVYQMWGPMPINTPDGKATGFVVLSDIPSQQDKLVAERHFVPGLGIVREIDYIIKDGVMVSKADLNLAEKPEEPAK